MKIVILNSDPRHPINSYLVRFEKELGTNHQIEIVRKTSEVSSGQILFLVSCNEKVSETILKKFEHSMVLHASDLPKGRGWSPHIWAIINGQSQITLTLLDADEEIDKGDIYLKKVIEIPKSALWDEINEILFSAEIDMMKFAVENFEKLSKNKQDQKIEPTYFRKRTPEDSKVDALKSIKEQFDLIRVCDPNRFPAYFEISGVQYKIILEKI